MQGKYIALILVSVFVAVVLAILFQPVTRVQIPLARRRLLRAEEQWSSITADPTAGFGPVQDATLEKIDALNHLHDLKSKLFIK